jgi:hypothetical protein
VTVEQALAAHFSPPAFAYFEQVRNGTGVTRVTRTADALAFGLWPSRGLFMHGVEIKTARSDWKRELADPEKAEEIAQYCDFWWLATSAGVAQLEELPAQWGWLELDAKGKLKIRKTAPKLEAKPISRQFLASLFRQLYTRESTIIAKRVDEQLRQEREREQHTFEDLRQRAYAAAAKATHAEGRLSSLVHTLGLKLHDESGDIDEASEEKVRLFRDANLDGLRAEARRAAEALKRVAVEARAVLRAGGVRTQKPRRDW